MEIVIGFYIQVITSFFLYMVVVAGAFAGWTRIRRRPRIYKDDDQRPYTLLKIESKRRRRRRWTPINESPRGCNVCSPARRSQFRPFYLFNGDEIFDEHRKHNNRRSVGLKWCVMS